MFSLFSMGSQGKTRQAVEYLCFRAAALAVPLLPRAVVVGVSRVLAGAAFRLSRRKRAVAFANLDLAFGDSMSPAEKRRIVRHSYRVFSLLIFDLFWFSRWTRRRAAAWVRFDPSVDLYLRTAPAIVVTAHLGNWEVMGHAVAAAGHPVVTVAAPLSNPFIDRLLNRFRQKLGEEVVPREGAAAKFLRVLRGGGRIALLMDQNTLPEDGGEFVPLFGLPVPVSRAVSVLSGRSGACTMFGFCLPDGRGRYTASGMLFGERVGGRWPPVSTQDVAAMIERVVRLHPEYWLWIYKRWKYIPPGHARGGYPFYARELAGTSGPAGPRPPAATMGGGA